MSASNDDTSQQTAVLLHSGGMSGRQWRKLGELLRSSHRVLAPDFLGSGERPLWPADQPFDFAADVELVLEAVRDVGQPVHLVGHSYGGLVAVTLARRAPELVRSIAAYDPVAFGVLYAADDTEGLADLERVAREPLFLDDARGGSEAWFEVFVDYWNGPGSWAAMPPPARDAFLRVGRKVYAEVRSLTADRTPASGYANVQAPSLFLRGERSPAAAQRVAALLADAFPRGRLETVAGAGHMGPITHAAIVNDVIAAHVRSAS